MGRRTSSNGAICVDEKILPRRFAKALLHAAYTDQVSDAGTSRQPAGRSPSFFQGGGSGGGCQICNNDSLRPGTVIMAVYSAPRVAPSDLQVDR